MENKLQIFKNQEFGQVRGILIDNEAYFLGNDVAKSLGYVDLDQSIRKHVDLEDRKVLKYKASVKTTPTLWSNKNDFSDKTLINESGMYSLIFGSKLESAKKFKHWVTSKVLPSIRKHGMYITDELLKDNKRLQLELNNYQSENDLLKFKNEELEEIKIEYMKQRNHILKLSIRTGNKGSYLPYLLVQIVKHYISNSDNVVYKDDDICKVNTMDFMLEIKKLVPRTNDAKYLLSFCLGINLNNKYAIIPCEILQDDYEALQDIMF